MWGELGEFGSLVSFAVVRSLIMMNFAICAMRLHDIVELSESSSGEPG